MIWTVAEEYGAAPEDRARLHAAPSDAENGEQLIRKAKAALTGPLRSLSKGREWGERLMRHAWENSEGPAQETRPIIEAVWAAQRGLRANFDRERAEFKVDPETGDTVER